MPIVMDCLKQVEYRGYDAAGVVVLQHGRLEVRLIAVLRKCGADQPGNLATSVTAECMAKAITGPALTDNEFRAGALRQA